TRAFKCRQNSLLLIDESGGRGALGAEVIPQPAEPLLLTEILLARLLFEHADEIERVLADHLALAVKCPISDDEQFRLMLLAVIDVRVGTRLLARAVTQPAHHL